MDLGIKAPTGETQTLELGRDEQWGTDCERQPEYKEPHITPVLPVELTVSIWHKTAGIVEDVGTVYSDGIGLLCLHVISTEETLVEWTGHSKAELLLREVMNCFANGAFIYKQKLKWKKKKKRVETSAGKDKMKSTNQKQFRRKEGSNVWKPEWMDHYNGAYKTLCFGQPV